MSRQLVCQYLENVSREVLERYQHLIRQYIRHRHGVYALYRRNKLYYVGLASNLKSRLSHHLRDRHANTWDRFSAYMTMNDSHMKELESLVLRIIIPKGNKQKGKFHRAENLKRRLRKDISQYQRLELENIIGGKSQKIQAEIASQGREPMLKRYINKKGFPLRLTYRGKTYGARVRRNGKIYFRHKLFNSPSLAAAAVLKRSNNGWYWWKYQRSPGEWVRIDELRK